MPLRAQAKLQQARTNPRPIASKKDHRHQQQRQSNAASGALKPLADIMQKGGQSVKEVDILRSGRQLTKDSKLARALFLSGELCEGY